MRKRNALRVLKRHGLINPGMSLWYLSLIKNTLWPASTWKEFVWTVAFGEYIAGNLPLKGVVIPELGIQFGGERKFKLVRNQGVR